MRIALISDIHGNTIALDAVLANIERQGGVDAYWLLGDYSAMGYDPVGVLERITRLPNASFARGNHDRYVVSGERPGPTLEQAMANPQLLPLVLAMATNLAWTQGHVRASGWLSWFEQLPLELRLALPDGTRLLGVHAAPSTDDGLGIIPALSDAQLRDLLAPAEAELVIVGHTHVPMDRTISGVRVLNLGSVSNPMKPRLQASYAVLEADSTGYKLQPRYVDYNNQAVIEELRRVKHPTADFLAQFMRGEISPPWAART
ncbi:MAG: metallophosphoesterase family protein [Ktedonobacteraceae bacterium]